MLRRGRLPIAALALAAFLTAGPAGAAPAKPGLDALWAWARAWLGISFKAGLSIDPNGDEFGSHIDPDGQPVPAPPGSTSDAGASIDPNGNERGSQIDPNG